MADNQTPETERGEDELEDLPADEEITERVRGGRRVISPY